MSSNTTETPAPSVAPTLWSDLFPRFLTAAWALFQHAPEGPERTEQLLKALDHNATQGDGEACAIWTAAAKLTRKVLIERPGPLPLIDYSEEFEKHSGIDWQALCAWCYLGASVDTGTAPRLAAALHMTVAEFLFNETHQRPELYEGAILPWFVAFWSHTFNNARFRFQTPRVIETELKTAIESPPDVRLQRLLAVVGYGLDIALPDEGQDWFKMYTS